MGVDYPAGTNSSSVNLSACPKQVVVLPLVDVRDRDSGSRSGKSSHSSHDMIRLPLALRRLVGRSASRTTESPVTEYNEPGSAVWHRTGFMHRQRYAFASRHVSGKRVLNIACGSGYGEEILMAGHPASIVAVDYDQDLIRRLQTQAAAGSASVLYRHADAEALPGSLGKFELFISLENIEHLRAPELFLAGIGRLALPGAKLILSTPNRLKYSEHPLRPFNNPFHVHEYDFLELIALVGPYLSDIETFGQVERNYMGLVDEVGAALRALNSLWIVRIERAVRQLVGRPARPFEPLSFETDLLPMSRERSDEYDTFIIIGTVR